MLIGTNQDLSSVQKNLVTGMVCASHLIGAGAIAFVVNKAIHKVLKINQNSVESKIAKTFAFVAGTAASVCFARYFNLASFNFMSINPRVSILTPSEIFASAMGAAGAAVGAFK